MVLKMEVNESKEIKVNIFLFQVALVLEVIVDYRIEVDELALRT